MQDISLNISHIRVHFSSFFKILEKYLQNELTSPKLRIATVGATTSEEVYVALRPSRRAGHPRVQWSISREDARAFFIFISNVEVYGAQMTSTVLRVVRVNVIFRL